jgi:von Willebrand factor type A domain
LTIRHRRLSGHCRFLISLLTLLLFAQGAPRPEAANIDWILLVDTSKSMIGLGKSKGNIFSKIRGGLKRFIRSRAAEGDTFHLYTFDQSVRLRPPIGPAAIGNPSEFSELINEQLPEPSGDYTHIADAIIAGLDRAKRLKRKLSDPNRRPVLILVTDGIEDVSDNEGALRLKDLTIDKDDVLGFPYFFVLPLGDGATNAKFFSSLPPTIRERAHILDGANTDTPSDLLPKILAQLPPAISLSSAFVDFGQIDADLHSEARLISVNAESPVTIRIRPTLEDRRQVRLLEPAGDIKLEAGQNQIPISIGLSSVTDETVYRGRLSIEHQASGATSASSGPVVTLLFQVNKPQKSAFEKDFIWLLLAATVTIVSSLTLRGFRMQLSTNSRLTDAGYTENRGSDERIIVAGDVAPRLEVERAKREVEEARRTDEAAIQAEIARLDAALAALMARRRIHVTSTETIDQEVKTLAARREELVRSCDETLRRYSDK